MTDHNRFFLRHWPALVSAIVVGLILVSPQIILQWRLGNDFHGVYIGGIDAEQYYPRVGEAYQGNVRIASPSLAEYKDAPYTITPLPELTLAAVGQSLGLTAPQAVVFGSFLFPALLFLILYGLFWALSEEKLFSLTAAAGILLASNLILFPRDIYHLFIDSKEIAVNVFNRPINPQVSSAYFFLWAFCFWPMVFGRKQKWRILFAGILFGALFYVYPFSWMLAVVFQGLVLVYLLWKKDYSLVKNVTVSGLIGLLVSIPFWINFFHVATSPLYELLKKHEGFYNTRLPIFSWLLIIDFGVLLFLYFKQKLRSQTVRFGIFFATALMILINQQVITNLRFFPGHWHWYYVGPLSIFVGLFFLRQMSIHWPRIHLISFILLLVIFLADGIFSQISYYHDSAPTAISTQRYGLLFDWLNQNTLKGSVVASGDALAFLIPFHTSDDHYLVNLYDTLGLIPEERIRHSFFTKIYFLGARADNLAEFINQKNQDLSYVLYGYWRRYAFGCQECYPEDELAKLQADYLEFLRQDFKAELKRYRIDYLVVDRTNPHWPQVNLDFASLVAEVSDFAIYQVN